MCGLSDTHTAGVHAFLRGAQISKDWTTETFSVSFLQIK